MSNEEAVFTDEEFDEYFGDVGEPLPPRSRRVPGWARLLGYAVVFAMFGGLLLTLVNDVISNPDIREPSAIETAALARVAESPYGWLVEEVRVVPIDRPRVGAFVTNNPPDGIIQIDLRPWSQDRLDELMDHEMGHLLDFALWDPFDVERKGGLGTEAWAECAAVDAGTRRIDPRDPGGEYHCFDDEYEIYVDTLNEITEICKRWGDRACRPFDREAVIR